MNTQFQQRFSTLGRTAFPLCGAEHDVGSTVPSTSTEALMLPDARNKLKQTRLAFKDAVRTQENGFANALSANFGGAERGYQRQVHC